MSFVAFIIALLCAIALIINLDTGSLTQAQVAGIMGLALVVGGLAPAGFPDWHR